MTPRRGERGYAMVAAVAGIAVFSAVAVGLVQSNQSTIDTTGAEVSQLHASAAADAGIAMALDGLLTSDRASRWSIDGRKRRLDFAGAKLIVLVEDERGKVPLNLLDELLADALVARLGLSDEPAKIARDSLLDWTDDDDETRPDGAEVDYYRPKGYRPRNGPLNSIDELALIRGFSREMVAKLRPFVTVNFGSGSFDARFANPAAISVMQGGGIDSPAVIDRQRELDGQRVAIELGDDFSLVGRPLMIVAVATTTDGGRSEHRAVVELTGSELRPYIVRSYD